ncbi:MAG: ROK family glucokinase [Eubacteriales bacterium]|nr:ROK family glucokinase [Eubacteriales bacterium]
MIPYIVAIDIGGTSMKAGIFTLDGEIQHKFVIKSDREDNGTRIIPNMISAIDENITQLKLDKNALEGIGITVPGPTRECKYVLKCVNLFWTEKKDLRKEVLDLLPKEYNKEKIIVRVGNDANLAALGEIWKGAGEGAKNAIIITLGTGVGGGIVIDGKVLDGTMGVGGEIGHIHISDDVDYNCNCGSLGCLEQFCASPGILYKTKKKLQNTKENSTLRNYDISKLEVKDIFNEAKNGDSIATEIVDDMSKKLGLAISILTNIIDPEVFLIGGGISKAGDFLIDKVKKYRDEWATLRIEKTPIKVATLGNDAGMYGACKLILDRMYV